MCSWAELRHWTRSFVSCSLNSLMSFARRLQQITQSLSPSRSLGRMATQAPKIRKVGPLPSEEAKWTELRKIEVRTRPRTSAISTMKLTERTIKWTDQVRTTKRLPTRRHTTLIRRKRPAATASGKPPPAKPAAKPASTPLPLRPSCATLPSPRPL